MNVQRLRTLTAILAVSALAVTACSGDDDTEPTAAPTTSAAATPTPDTSSSSAPPASGNAPTSTDASDAGCGQDAQTDPADLSPDRPVARCAAGYPAPKPLDERAKVVISSSSKSEAAAFLYLAIQEGEFEKENLDIQLVDLRFAEAIPQMLTGQVQVGAGSPEAAWYNAVGQDIGVHWVMGNFFPPHAGDVTIPQTGLWARRDIFTDPQNPDFTELAGKTLGSAVGPASAIMYPINEALTALGVDINTVQVQQLPSADVVTALENGAVDAAWLLDPTWTPIADSPDYVLVATQPPGEPLGNIFFSDDWVSENHDAAVAVLRAMIRTINTYLAGDYEADPAIVEKIATAVGSTPEAIAGGMSEPLTFDWEIRQGTTDRIQETFEIIGGVLQQPLIPEDQLVDRSLYTEAVTA